MFNLFGSKKSDEAPIEIASKYFHGSMQKPLSDFIGGIIGGTEIDAKEFARLTMNRQTEIRGMSPTERKDQLRRLGFELVATVGVFTEIHTSEILQKNGAAK